MSRTASASLSSPSKWRKSVSIAARIGVPAIAAFIWVALASWDAPIHTNSAMKSSIGLPNRPINPNTNASPCPMPAAVWVAFTYSIRDASRARNTRPPSIGKAGIRLNRTSQTLATSSRSTKGPEATCIWPSGAHEWVMLSQTNSAAEMATFTADRQRDPKLLGGLLRHPFQARDAADGQQSDVPCGDTVSPRRQGVTQLMQEHAAEQCQDEGRPAQRRVHAPAGDPMARSHPDKQQEKGEVYARFNSSQCSDFPRPLHFCFPSRECFPFGSVLTGARKERMRRSQRR